MFGWGQQTVVDSSPQPQSEEEFTEVAKECLNSLQELARETEADGWARIEFSATYGENDVELFEKPCGDSPINTLKEALLIYWDPDVTRRQEWEREVMGYDVVHDINKDITVVRARYEAPFPVTNREFVALRCKAKLPDGTLVTYGTSVQHPKCPAGDGGFVRATVLTGIFCKPVPEDPNKCFCVRVININPKGNIPAWIINKGKLKAATSLILVRKLIDRVHPSTDSRRPKVEWEEEVILHKEEPIETKKIVSKKGKEKAREDEVEKPRKKPKKKRQVEEKAQVKEIVVVSQRHEGEEEFFDASNQFPWREDFDQHTKNIADLVLSLQQSLERIEKTSTSINNRLTALERTPAGPAKPASALAKKAAFSFTNLSWGSIAFLVAWPLLVLSIYEFVKNGRRTQRK